MEKLYVVVRNDLPPGLQVAQACHALREFVARHPGLDEQWYRGSNNLVILQVRGKADLDVLRDRADKLEIAYADFHEPDMGGTLTAVAFSAEAKLILSNLPLALRSEPREYVDDLHHLSAPSQGSEHETQVAGVHP